MWKNKFIYLNVRKLKGNSINTLDAEDVSFSLRHSLIHNVCGTIQYIQQDAHNYSSSNSRVGFNVPPNTL